MMFAALFVPLLYAESHPAWWGYASPQATALVGIRWENLRQSPFADAIAAELSSAGSFGFPDLACLQEARQIVISSPEFLAVAWGTFLPDALRSQAQASGFRAATYKGVTLWITSKRGALSVAQISEQLILVGGRSTLQAAIDNSLLETGRRMSPLLPRAAQFSQKADLWVVSSQLPDPLANVFVPIDAQARGFEGSISVREGLNLEASLDTAAYEEAVTLAKSLREITPSLPAVAQDLKVGVEENKVRLWLRLTPEDLAAGLKSDRATQAAAPAPATAEPAPSVAKTEPPASAPPVIRIVGLDDGPREIPFPASPQN